MSAVPGYMLSPSPVSLIQYAVLTWILWGYLSRHLHYKKNARLLSLIDSFFVVAFFVCVTDAFWVSFTLIKWLPLHPGDLGMLAQSLIRDLAGAALFGLFIYDAFKTRVLEINRSVILWILICFGSQALWFWLAPSPAFTDYTYAWRHGSDIGIIIGSWILSHFVMRIPLWLAIIKTRSLEL